MRSTKHSPPLLGAALALSAALAVTLGAGCTQPLMRSMRVEPGPALAAGAEVLIGGEEASSTSANGDGGSEEREGAFGLWPINLDFRYGWVSDLGAGIAAGVYAPGVYNQKITGSASGCLPPLWLFTPYVQLGVVQGPFAASFGGEAGCGAGALFGGADLRLVEDDFWSVSLSPVGRWTTPWGPEGTTPADQVPRGDSLEAGGSLRVGPIFALYSHEWAIGPPRAFEHPGGSLEARTWHTVMLGLDIVFERH